MIAATTGDTVTVRTPGHTRSRADHVVTTATPTHLTVDGRAYRRSDGRERGSSPCGHRCRRLEVRSAALDLRHRKPGALADTICRLELGARGFCGCGNYCGFDDGDRKACPDCDCQGCGRCPDECICDGVA